MLTPKKVRVSIVFRSGTDVFCSQREGAYTYSACWLSTILLYGHCTLHAYTILYNHDLPTGTRSTLHCYTVWPAQACAANRRALVYVALRHCSTVDLRALLRLSSARPARPVYHGTVALGQSLGLVGARDHTMARLGTIGISWRIALSAVSDPLKVKFKYWGKIVDLV